MSDDPLPTAEVNWQQKLRRIGQTKMTEHDPVALDVEARADDRSSLKGGATFISVTGILTFTRHGDAVILTVLPSMTTRLPRCILRKDVVEGEMMKVLITGGAGFLGTRLARALLARGHMAGEAIRELTLVDLVAPSKYLQEDRRVDVRVGDLLSQCEALGGSGCDVIFHLAAATSAECEADFQLGMRSNLETTGALLESLRRPGSRPRFIFASSVAVFGSESDLPLPLVVRDDTLPVPQSSYGVQKFICEQLVSDYTRKNFIDGRTARLMTVAVRPGRPNGAASSFLSNIIREPLHGEPAICPVPEDTTVALASPGRTIEGLIAIAEANRDLLGGRTAVNLPSLTVRVGEMLRTLEEVGGHESRKLVRYEPDPRIESIVGGWPSAFDSDRARRLGLKPDPDFRSIVEEFVREDAGVSIHAAEGTMR
jgi:D-erythronate 2-dehydrogenase